VYTAANATVQVIDPIDGVTVLATVSGKDISISEKPSTIERQHARSMAIGAPVVRRRASISMKQNTETLALINILKAWQTGFTYYALASDLKGVRYHHPHLKITLDGTTDQVVMAYDCKLSDWSLGLTVGGGPANESFSIDALGGLGTGREEHGVRGVRSIAFHRTGSATHTSTSHVLVTASDGQGRFGLPGTTGLRNLYSASNNLLSSVWTKDGFTVTKAGTYNGSDTFILVRSATENWRGCNQAKTLKNGKTYTLSARFKAGSANPRLEVYNGAAPTLYVWGNFNLATGSVGSLASSGSVSGASSAIVAESDGWYKCSITFTVTATLGGSVGVKLQTSGSTIGETVYVCKPQFEEASSVSEYQETAVITAPTVSVSALNGAGLAVEGSSSNLYDPAQNNPDVTSSTDTVNGVSQTIYQLDARTNASYEDFQTGVYYNVASASSTYTISFWAKWTDFPSFDILCYDSATTLLGSATKTWLYQPSPNSGQYQYYALRVTFPANTTKCEFFRWWYDSTDDTNWGNLCQVQLENNPFPTSYMTPLTSRNADVIGIVSPHNLLKYSEELDNAVWLQNSVTPTANSIAGPDNTTTADTLTKTAATNKNIKQTITGNAVFYTFSVWLKAGTLTSADLLIYDETTAGTLSAFTTVQLTSAWQRFTVVSTTKPTAGDSVSAYIYPDRNGATSGTIYAWGAQLVEGNHPGIYVRTADRAISKPVDGGIDPAWQQNGYVEFDLLPPPVSAAKSFGYFAAPFTYNSASNPLQFGRADYSGATDFDVWFARTHNGVTGSNSIAGLSYFKKSSFDFGKHRWRLEWMNYTLNGVRVVKHNLYFDGTLVSSQDAASLFGATAWTDIDLTKLISNGSVFAIISNLVLGYPTLPDGAIVDL